MDNETISNQKPSWERLAVILPLAVAGFFLCSAAFLVGQTIGIGRREIVWIFTVSDIANNTLSLGALFVGIFFISLTSVTGSQNRKPAQADLVPLLRGIAVAIIFLAIILASVATFKGLISWKTAAVAIGILMSLWLFSHLWVSLSIDILPPIIILSVNALILSLVLSAGGGAVQSYVAIRGPDMAVVTTSSESFRSHYIFVLDRGVALFEDTGFRLVPWSEIKAVNWIEENARPAKIGN